MILPILEARAEILQNICFTFWEISDLKTPLEGRNSFCNKILFNKRILRFIFLIFRWFSFVYPVKSKRLNWGPCVSRSASQQCTTTAPFSLPHCKIGKNLIIITVVCIIVRRLACLWSKMPMFQRAGMREGREPLPLAF